MKNKFPDCVHNDKKIANIIVWLGSLTVKLKY